MTNQALADLVRDQRTYLKRDIVNALDGCADVKAYKEGTPPDLAMFDDRKLTVWADANAEQLLDGASRQNGAFWLGPRRRNDRGEERPRAAKEEWLLFAVNVCKAAGAAEDVDLEARPVVHLSASALAFLNLVLWHALMKGGLCDLPSHDPELADMRTRYGEFYALLEHGMVEGVVPMRGPSQYYSDGKGLKLRMSVAVKKRRPPPAGQNAGGQGRGGPGQGGGGEPDEAAQE